MHNTRVTGKFPVTLDSFIFLFFSYFKFYHMVCLLPKMVFLASLKRHDLLLFLANLCLMKFSQESQFTYQDIAVLRRPSIFY